MLLSINDPASVPFSMIDMDPEVNQLDTVTGVSPTMGTLGLGLGTVGLPDSQGLSADMYNTMPAPSSPYVLPRMSTSGIQYTAHQPCLLATPACQGHTASFMSPPMVSSRISSKPTTSATATGSQVMYTTVLLLLLAMDLHSLTQHPSTLWLKHNVRFTRGEILVHQHIPLRITLGIT